MVVSQPGKRPTNKLTAAAVAALAVSLVQLAVRNLAPEWHDEMVFATLMPVAVGLVGYVIKDAPNT